MAYDTLLTRRDGVVEYMTLNRPDVRNAFNEAMIAELTAWAASINADDDVRVAVIAYGEISAFDRLSATTCAPRSAIRIAVA